MPQRVHPARANPTRCRFVTSCVVERLVFQQHVVKVFHQIRAQFFDGIVLGVVAHTTRTSVPRWPASFSSANSERNPMVDALLMYCSRISASNWRGFWVSKYAFSAARMGLKKGKGFSG